MNDTFLGKISMKTMNLASTRSSAPWESFPPKSIILTIYCWRPFHMFAFIQSPACPVFWCTCDHWLHWKQLNTMYKLEENNGGTKRFLFSYGGSHLCNRAQQEQDLHCFKFKWNLPGFAAMPMPWRWIWTSVGAAAPNLIEKAVNRNRAEIYISVNRWGEGLPVFTLELKFESWIFAVYINHTVMDI